MRSTITWRSTEKKPLPRRGAALLALTSVLLTLAGCLNPSVRVTADEDASLIFGFFDVSEAPARLDSVQLTQGERVGLVYRQSAMTTSPDGLFFMENIPPMRYHIPFFRMGGKLYPISSSATEAIDVPPHVIAFVGCYEYRPAGWRKFELAPISTPSEAEVFKMLLERVKDPKWKEQIRARLRVLESR